MLMVYSCITENTQRERERQLFGSSFPICASHLSLAGRTHHFEPFRHFGKCVLVIKCEQPCAWSIFCAAASSREASSPHLLPAAHRSMARYRGLVPVPKGWCCKEHGGSQYEQYFSSPLCEPQVGLAHDVFGSSQWISSSRLSQSIDAFWAASHNVEAGNQCTLWSCLLWVPLLTTPSKIQGSDLLSSAPVSRGPAPERFPNNICSMSLKDAGYSQGSCLVMVPFSGHAECLANRF